jgi:hypothetical protein
LCSGGLNDVLAQNFITSPFVVSDA